METHLNGQNGPACSQVPSIMRQLMTLQKYKLVIFYLADVKFWCRDPGRHCVGFGMICKRKENDKTDCKQFVGPHIYDFSSLFLCLVKPAGGGV